MEEVGEGVVDCEATLRTEERMGASAGVGVCVGEVKIGMVLTAPS